MNVVFMGTPDFAVKTLEMLIKKHNVLAVVTQPDKPKGRGKKLVFPVVKEIALQNGIEVLQPVSAKDPEFAERLKGYNADIFVVAAYGQILPENVLNIPEYGSVNVHGSLLPKYRGAAPMQRAVMDGCKVTGVTIMHMAKGLDCGDMISKKEVAVSDDDTYGSLGEKLASAGAELLEQTLVQIENGTAAREKQDDSLATYAHMISREETHIDWKRTAFEISCFVRGLSPNMGAYTILNGDILKIWKVQAVDIDYAGECGQICGIDKKGFIVKCGSGSVKILSVQAKGGKEMDTGSYMRGHSVETGTVLQ
ncbi:methionyl-tRNA formyltransferase [Lachnospiraceae bacterium NSJ-143]|nr:methionyl-tRNA formyltransferase [Lachnospiraceae bacterium NSJ-143]